MSGNGTRKGISNLYTISEKYTDLNRDVFAYFIDCEKVLGKISHKEVVESLINVASLKGQ